MIAVELIRIVAQRNNSNLCECDKVLWVCLNVIEDDKHGWSCRVVSDAVIQVCIPRASGGRRDHSRPALDEVSNQNPGQVHALMPAGISPGITLRRVDRVHRKVRSIAICCTYRK